MTPPPVTPSSGSGERPLELAHSAVELVRRWLAEAPHPAPGERPDAHLTGARKAAARLASLLRDPAGPDFARGFVDGVLRPQDVFVAGYNLQRLAKRLPAFLPWYQRLALKVGGVLGPVIPGVVVPLARRVLRRMTGHLVVDASTDQSGTDHSSTVRSGTDKLGRQLAALRERTGARLALNLLGETVLGEAEASRRLDGIRALLERDDVDYVSIKLSSIESRLNLWAFDETVARIVEKLTPLYELAARGARPKFITLDVEEYRDLDLTLAVFRRVLAQPQLQQLEAGIVLQAYLPDALDALQGLTEWATARRAGGGAAITVRIVKGANLPMERVDATLHGWPLATYDSKRETDTNYLRVLDWALTPEHTHAVKVGVAGHNLFFVAYAWLLAVRRGVEDRVGVEMLLGMAVAQAEAVRETTGSLLLYTPVVHPHEFDVAVAYLVRRLEENASGEDYLASAFRLSDDPAAFDRELRRFLDAVEALEADVGPRGLAPLPRRTQDRALEHRAEAISGLRRDASPDGRLGRRSTLEHGAEAISGLRRARSTEAATERPNAGHDDPSLTSVVLGISRGERDPQDLAGVDILGPFRNEPDTDPSLAANRQWARRILARSTAPPAGSVQRSTVGSDTVKRSRLIDERELDALLDTVRGAGDAWGSQLGFDRAALLDRAGLALAANRDRLIEVMVAEAGKTLAEADPEVSEAVDFAHYYAARARELDTVQGAVFEPSRLTVVAPPWNFPVSIPAGSVLAALAAGSGVVIKPAPQARRCAAVMVEALWEAGVPRELLALVDVDEDALGRRLIADPRVDRVLLTGSYDTAALFRSWRPELPLLAETSGKNSMIVTPAADYDLAVTDIVHSAFGHAGQKCSAASLAILVGSVGRSERFERQLVDAVTSIPVGYPNDPEAVMGPLIEPPQGKLLHALTTLGADESWLVRPRQLDASGRLWSPGVRTGVQPGSYFHLTEFFGPVLGVMRARTLREAIELQNAVPYGLTAGLQSLDSGELAQWLDTVQAGNLYVNRGITGAIVQRQPFGGWKRSSVGAGAKAGGPNSLFALGSWHPEPGRSSASLHLRGLDERVSTLIESGQPDMGYEEFDLVRRSALSDAIAFAAEYEPVKDAAGLGIERNLLRYLPVPVAIRLAEGAGLPQLLRVLAAATLVRSRFSVSVPARLPRGIRTVLRSRGVEVTVESDAEWLGRIARDGVTVEGAPAGRLRLIAPPSSRGERAETGVTSAALRGSPDVAIYAGEVTPSGRVELLPFLREQAVSITAHRFGTPDTFSDSAL